MIRKNRTDKAISTAGPHNNAIGGRSDGLNVQMPEELSVFTRPARPTCSAINQARTLITAAMISRLIVRPNSNENARSNPTLVDDAR